MTDPVLQISGLSAGYGRFNVVHDITMHINNGEAVALLGPNGAGKTSVLRSISGRRLQGVLQCGNSFVQGCHGDVPYEIVVGCRCSGGQKQPRAASAEARSLMMVSRSALAISTYRSNISKRRHGVSEGEVSGQIGASMVCPSRRIVGVFGLSTCRCRSAELIPNPFTGSDRDPVPQHR